MVRVKRGVIDEIEPAARPRQNSTFSQMVNGVEVSEKDGQTSSRGDVQRVKRRLSYM